MKKVISILCSSILSLTGICTTGFLVKDKDEVKVDAKSAYLMDFNSGECIYKVNENDRMPIASVCKVMTLTLCFDAIKAEKISLEDTVTVSKNAASMGGSQVFLSAGNKYSIDSLVKSIVICSANDSCVAVAETVSGSESGFVSAMNVKAKELGCENTLFSNCTGLPKPNQYSCARDVAIMFKNLLNYNEYFNYSKIWLEDFAHEGDRVTSMTNTNKLLKKYSLCDGGKTGFTNEAGFCFAATAKKGNLRLITAVLGAESSDNRFKSSINLFEYGFGNFENKVALEKGVLFADEFKVRGGKKKCFSVYPERDSFIFCKINSSPNITYNIIPNEDIKAPLEIEQKVGKVEIFKDGVLYDTVDVVAAEPVKKAGFKDYFKDVSENWAM